jgi:hypothetical protein
MRIMVKAVKIGNRNAGDRGQEMFPAREYTIHISNIESLEDATTTACGKMQRVRATRIRTKAGGYFKVLHASEDVFRAVGEAYLTGENVSIPTTEPQTEAATPMSWVDREAEPWSEVDAFPVRPYSGDVARARAEMY